MMSNYITSSLSWLLLLALLYATEVAKAELELSSNIEQNLIQAAKRVVIRKCCKEDEILVESNVGVRSCKLRSEYIEGKFKD